MADEACFCLTKPSNILALIQPMAAYILSGSPRKPVPRRYDAYQGNDKGKGDQGKKGVGFPPVARLSLCAHSHNADSDTSYFFFWFIHTRILTRRRRHTIHFSRLLPAGWRHVESSPLPSAQACQTDTLCTTRFALKTREQKCPLDFAHLPSSDEQSF